MLQRLQIENYALIDRLDLEFHAGLNLLSGETGSGKSIVVDAVELLLGSKASTDVVRSGADRAKIVGVFSAPATSRIKSAAADVRELFESSGLDYLEGEELVVQREVLAGGKSRSFLNHQPVTVALCREISAFLAEVHGQNEQQELFSPAAQLQMLDRFGRLEELTENVRERYKAWKNL